MKQIQDASKALAEFEKTRDLDLLETTVESLENADPAEPEPILERLKARRRIMRGWLAAIVLVERFQDSAFQPDEPPPAKVRPPRTAGGAQLPPGIHPKYVTDPSARAEYEREIAANREKAVKHEFETRLREYQREIWESMNGFVRRYFTEAKGDRDELVNLLDGAKVTGQARERLMANLPLL